MIQLMYANAPAPVSAGRERDTPNWRFGMRPYRIKNLVGMRFGRLVVVFLNLNRTDRGRVQWGCRCDCGDYKLVAGTDLKCGNTSSCGCLKVESVRMRCVTHGRTRTTEYRIWSMMRNRCQNPRNRAYAYYGGRGIDVCPEWEDFSVFYRDMGPRPGPGYSIDRVNNDLGYSPSNCRWATAREQANNRRPARSNRWTT